MKTFKDIFKTNKTTSFKIKPMENLSAHHLHPMIRNGDFPSYLQTKDKERINELYNSGKTFDAVRKLQGIIDSQNKPNRSFV